MGELRELRDKFGINAAPAGVLEIKASFMGGAWSEGETVADDQGGSEDVESEERGVERLRLNQTNFQVSLGVGEPVAQQRYTRDQDRDKSQSRTKARKSKYRPEQETQPKIRMDDTTSSTWYDADDIFKTPSNRGSVREQSRVAAQQMRTSPAKYHCFGATEVFGFGREKLTIIASCKKKHHKKWARHKKRSRKCSKTRQPGTSASCEPGRVADRRIREDPCRPASGRISEINPCPTTPTVKHMRGSRKRSTMRPATQSKSSASRSPTANRAES
ncbi:hypothetical protein K438DRAFT_1925024 [Mycena galopus ATCC 62051]|nr:hypothetical protein K438DRAFT_1925024 [Mycena galopus ATCC 62051]